MNYIVRIALVLAIVSALLSLYNLRRNYRIWKIAEANAKLAREQFEAEKRRGAAS